MNNGKVPSTPTFTGVTGPMSEEAISQLRQDVAAIQEAAERDRRVSIRFLIETQFDNIS